MRVILTILFFLFFFSCFSQDKGENLDAVMPNFRQVSYPFLPSITSNNFYFTNDGLMWFSTAKGLTAFDGTSVRYHSSDTQSNELELNKIACYAEDKFNNLYLGTRLNFLYYNRKIKSYTPIKYSFKDTKKNGAFDIMSLYIDNANMLYAGVYSHGLFIYNPETKQIEHLNLDDSKQDSWDNRINNTVKCISPNSTDKNKLWIGTFNGIYLFDKKTKSFTKNFKVQNPSMGLDGTVKSFLDVQKMEIINDSIIWFNSWTGGLCEYNSKTGKVQVYLQKGIPGSGIIFSIATIPAFIRMSDNVLLVGAHNNKSCLFDIQSKQSHPLNITRTLLSHDRVDFVNKDKNGHVWVLRNGLLYIDIPKYGRIQSTDISKQLTADMNANELRGICYDSITHQYYGAVRFSSGVYVFDSSFQVVDIIPTPLYTNAYTYRETCTDKITIDGSGRIWVTGHETYVKLPGQKKFDYIRNVFPSLKWIEKKGEFFSLLTTKEGDVLLRGYDADVYIINHKTLYTDTAKIQKFDYNGNYIISPSTLLYDSVRSFIYYSNDYGVIQYNLKTKEIKKIIAQEFLGKEKTTKPLIKFALDYLGRIWAMHINLGFRILDPLSLKCIDSFSIRERGLKAENYTNIINGGRGFMILQGQNGVVIYNYKKQHSFLFDNTNGLNYQVAYSLLYCNNHMVVSNANSVLNYNTDLFEKNNFSLKPAINLIFSDTTIVYDRDINHATTEIHLKHFQHNLRFSFSAPEFVFPERIEYEYQLSGFEDSWQYASYFKREVSYTSLAPGKYIFKIKAQMQGGNWQLRPVEYVIIISPAWWQTDLFIILLAAFFIGLVILIYHLRVQSIHKKAKVDLLHEKELIELEAKALRAQMNPHFIFNSLNSIKSLIQQNETEKSVTYLTTFSKLIRTLLNNADKKLISLYDEIETCKLYLQLEAMRFDTKFSYAVNVDETIDLKSIQIPALIIQPFIENAIWHGIVPRKAGGKVSLNVLRNDGVIEVVIDDDGIGREASKQNKSASGLTHQSKGVNLTQSRLELNNLLQQRQAELEVMDKKDEHGIARGTTVIIKIKEE